MKRNLTRLLALLAAAVLMLSLAACGKESGADVTGRYNCIAVAYDGENFTAPDGGDSYVTLKKGGKGEISSELNFELTWKLDGENFSGSYTIFGIDVPVASTLKDGVLEIEDEGEGVVTRYLKEGMDTPEWAQSLEAAPNEDGRLAGRYTFYAMSIGGDYYDYTTMPRLWKWTRWTTAICRSIMMRRAATPASWALTARSRKRSRWTTSWAI